MPADAELATFADATLDHATKRAKQHHWILGHRLRGIELYTSSDFAARFFRPPAGPRLGRYQGSDERQSELLSRRRTVLAQSVFYSAAVGVRGPPSKRTIPVIDLARQ